jgi:hypothetical protein
VGIDGLLLGDEPAVLVGAPPGDVEVDEDARVRLHETGVAVRHLPVERVGERLAAQALVAADAVLLEAERAVLTIGRQWRRRTRVAGLLVPCVGVGVVVGHLGQSVAGGPGVLFVEASVAHDATHGPSRRGSGSGHRDIVPLNGDTAAVQRTGRGTAHHGAVEGGELAAVTGALDRLALDA